MRRNVLALSGRAVEASGDVDVLLLDKTGTITLGNRQAAEFVPMPGVEEVELAEAAQLASLADETPEGRSIVVLAKQLRHPRARARHARVRAVHRADAHERHRPRRLAAAQGRRRLDHPLRRGRGRPGARASSSPVLDRIAREGGTPLAVARDAQVLGVVYLKDTVKDGMARALRAAARDGHPHGHGHRRQPPHRGQDRRGGRASTTSSPRPRRSASSS